MDKNWFPLTPAISGGAECRTLQARVSGPPPRSPNPDRKRRFICDRVLGVAEIGDTGRSAQGSRNASARAHLGVGGCASLRGVLE
jgi:hypothetical protein